MAASEQEVWRWNANPVWLRTCWMFEESYRSISSIDFIRQHHTQGCLYFAVSALEAFLNQEMRLKLEAEKLTESEIWKRLRKPSLDDKLKKWPAELAGHQVPLLQKHYDVISKFKALRDEGTHPKQKDHSHYSEINDINASWLVDNLVEIIVIILSECGKQFPYWLLGWNYVGLNGNPLHPFESDNYQFQYSLRALGFDVPTGNEYATQWQNKFMTTLEGYHCLWGTLKACPNDIEPSAGTGIRLTRRWWDAELVKESTVI